MEDQGQPFQHLQAGRRWKQSDKWWQLRVGPFDLIQWKTTVNLIVSEPMFCFKMYLFFSCKLSLYCVDIAWANVVDVLILLWGYLRLGMFKYGFPRIIFYVNFDSHSCYGYFQLLFLWIMMFCMTLFISISWFRVQ